MCIRLGVFCGCGIGWNFSEVVSCFIGLFFLVILL